jgi:hypothetical protein
VLCHVRRSKRLINFATINTKDVCESTNIKFQNYIYSLDRLSNIEVNTVMEKYHLKAKDGFTIALHLIVFSAIVLDSFKVKQRVYRTCPLGIVC